MFVKKFLIFKHFNFLSKKIWYITWCINWHVNWCITKFQAEKYKSIRDFPKYSYKKNFQTAKILHYF